MRSTLEKYKVTDEPEIFFPIGLYPNQNVLNKQIEKLKETADFQPYRAELQLLLGYQLIGIEQFKQAEDALINAKKDLINADAANILLLLLNRTL